MQNNLNLFSTELYSLNEIIEIFSIFYSNGILNKNQYIKIIQIFEGQSKISKNNGEYLYQIFDDLYQFLKENIGKDKKFSKIMNKIISCENSKINNIEFTKKLLNIILEKNEFICESSPLIKSIWNEIIDKNKNDKKTYFDLIKDNKSELLTNLNNSKNLFLDEIIIDYFEGQINLYFQATKDNNKLNEEYIKNFNQEAGEYNLIFNKSLEIFKISINYLSENNNNINNLHLCQLYAISFIKIYLNKVVYFLIKYGIQIINIANIYEIVRLINNENLSKVIKLYFIKLLYFKLNSFEKLNNFNTENSILNDFEWKEKNEDENDKINKNEEGNNNDQDRIENEVKNEQDEKPIILIIKDKDKIEFPSDKNTENENPFVKYFILTEYSNKETLKNNLKKDKDKYPLLNQILSLDSNIKKLEYLPNINKFSNYMIGKYSYRTLRNDAKNKKLDYEDIKEPEFSNFIQSWEKIKDEDALVYKNWTEMKPINLSNDKELIYFLIDDSELGYGMHIAAAYQSFIYWQNTFLDPIIRVNDKEDGILHFYNHNLKKKIHVQDAQISNIIKIDDIDIENIINKYTKRDIFNEDGTINYENYNSFIYDYDSIEKELGANLLPGKCLFDEDLTFVTFWSEENPEILTEFSKKYPQRELNEDEKKIIIEYLTDKYEKENFNSKEFFSSFYLLFCHLNNNLDEQNIKSILEIIQKNLNVSHDFKEFFEKKEIEFKINTLMNIFLYIEHLCFNEICKNLDTKFKSSLQEDKKQIILYRLNKDKKKNELSKALRRYIIRYLIGNKNIEKIEKNNLVSELSKSDLWGVNLGNINEIKKFLNEKLSDINLTIFDAFDFYNIIGKEDQEFIEKIKPQSGESDDEDSEEDKNVKKYF